MMEKLISRIQAGESDSTLAFDIDTFMGVAFIAADLAGQTKLALAGSVDAAVRLKNAFLPGWSWGIDWVDTEGANKFSFVHSEYRVISCPGPTPSTALLIAIIRATQLAVLKVEKYRSPPKSMEITITKTNYMADITGVAELFPTEIVVSQGAVTATYELCRADAVAQYNRTMAELTGNG